MFLALAQGQIEATVVTSTVAAATVKSGKFKDLQVGRMRLTTSTTWG